MAERTCRGCGCTHVRGCVGGCFWVLPDLCSRCAISRLTVAGLHEEARLLHDVETVAFERAADEADLEGAFDGFDGPALELPEIWQPGMR